MYHIPCLFSSTIGIEQYIKRYICILLLLNPMQENFRAQHMAMLHRLNHNGKGVISPESYSSGMRRTCQRVGKHELCKPNQACCAGFPCEPPHNHEPFAMCTPNEGCAACTTDPPYKNYAINTANTRQTNIPQTMLHANRIAGGTSEKFAGKIDCSKYGNYGTSMLQPVETFCPGASNARLNGAALDMSWASGTMDAICRRGIQPFNPNRYGQYKA